jgi:hypothetical protein
MHLVFSK